MDKEPSTDRRERDKSGSRRDKKEKHGGPSRSGKKEARDRDRSKPRDRERRKDKDRSERRDKKDKDRHRDRREKDKDKDKDRRKRSRSRDSKKKSRHDKKKEKTRERDRDRKESKRHRTPSSSPEVSVAPSRSESQSVRAASASSASTERAAIEDKKQEPRWVVVKNLNDVPVSPDELFWLFTQFGEVWKIIEATEEEPSHHHHHHHHHHHNSNQTSNKPTQCFYVHMAENYHEAVTYFLLKDITFKAGTTRFRLNCTWPTAFNSIEGQQRDYTSVNAVLRDMLMSVDSDEAADGLEVLFESNKWVQRDFIWGRWVAGDGWLAPKQDESHFKRMIPVVSSRDELAVHIGGLWREVTPEDVWRLAGTFGKLRTVSSIQKIAWCVVRYATEADATRTMKLLNGVPLTPYKKLRCDEFHHRDQRLNVACRHETQPVVHLNPPASRVLLNNVEHNESSIENLYRILDVGDAQVHDQGGKVMLQFPTIGRAVVFLAKYNCTRFEGELIEMQFAENVASMEE
ncbi:hypothetical protein DIPPA_05098 [Diplonema papillatum]|nr:hypothetical protein DIPPA_05098 [Diplonema papillatum]